MMKRTILTFLTLVMLFTAGIENVKAQQNNNKKNETIFIWGGDINLKMVEYIADLTKKESPRICYLPTAAADNQDNIKYWGYICNTLKLDTVILKVWVSSSEKNQSFEDILLNTDAIVVGGGNTLNMLGIWKAQGIDVILKDALNKGIIVAGGSAGSICWFQNGISDSRPVNLSVVDGLGVLPYSNCPHYSQENRRDLYHRMIIEKQIPFGYANDELAGILFKNGKAVEFVSQSDNHNSYFVNIEKGKIKSQKLNSRILLRKNALPEGSYSSLSVNKNINNLLDVNDSYSPLNAYVMEIKTTQLNNPDIDESKKNKKLEINVPIIFLYNNKIAGVVNDAYLDSFGYGLWYFYNHNGVWTSIGEDIGGETVLESEVTFREKAEIIIKRAEEKLN
ncbi:peptidase E [Parabacteroides sp. PF5-5]|uniref:Type 1 glutamine amidotransferase-like domain-containing protein n=1 Tax=unclassified Parabacteroides TaxID=2649774 RepID=UPI00247572E9|nr:MULTISPECIES: peptidase E [unclassified Parabacteroides]MDH6303859.1 peptidase E [Parabacteroides sp. PH5-39]MDH6314476.1 peptidase E [Parabacteroides sp. PF5-13]MDH6318459.1 peptidase E [Parabacteroides sp. PH5-13]MDH6322248.1 peptidase E [Parabacteroides sp. PH5-8]MDH6325672.1 peptidase E [Parabacteroides sp. PH5-41]